MSYLTNITSEQLKADKELWSNILTQPTSEMDQPTLDLLRSLFGNVRNYAGTLEQWILDINAELEARRIMKEVQSV